LRRIAIAVLSLLAVCPAPGRAEAFGAYWSTLSPSERDFVDRVAAAIYAEERGRRSESFSHLNSAGKARYRAQAVESLGVANRPARVRQNGKDI
jgi:hypothetical protein